MTRWIIFLGLLPLGCNEQLSQPRIVALYDPHDSSSNGDGGHVIPEPICEGRCCPTAEECYPAGNPSAYSAAECLAQRDNTAASHWQLRQTFSVSITPPGIAASQIANILAQRSELRWPACNAPRGLGGFMQLVDMDREQDTALVGFAKHVADAQTALEQGLCFVEGTYDDPDWALSDLYAPPSGWPKGLPPPMPLPWRIRPTRSYRYRDSEGNYADFDVETQRGELLARFDPVSGDLYETFEGLFYLNEATGYVHGYAPVTYILNYDSATQFNAVPIREAEMKMQINDPAHPNCSGALLGDNPDLPSTCNGDATNRAWGCPENHCGSGEQAPTVIEGYFLIVELEQIYNSLLVQTLCRLFPGGEYPGWQTTGSCRSDTARWDPKDPENGLPPGDWCATTNSPATETCHDAWKSISYATFQAFPIREATCAPD